MTIDFHWRILGTRGKILDVIPYFSPKLPIIVSVLSPLKVEIILNSSVWIPPTTFQSTYCYQLISIARS